MIREGGQVTYLLLLLCSVLDFESFMCLDLILELYQSFLFQIFFFFTVTLTVCLKNNHHCWHPDQASFDSRVGWECLWYSGLGDVCHLDQVCWTGFSTLFLVLVSTTVPKGNIPKGKCSSLFPVQGSNGSHILWIFNCSLMFYVISSNSIHFCLDCVSTTVCTLPVVLIVGNAPCFIKADTADLLKRLFVIEELESVSQLTHICDRGIKSVNYLSQVCDRGLIKV